MPAHGSNRTGSSNGSRRKAAPTAKNNLAAGLVTGAVLAAVVGGGAVAFSAASGNSNADGDKVVQLDTADDRTQPDDGLVAQLPVGNNSGGPPTGGIDTGGLTIPDTLLPEGFGQGGLDAEGRPAPSSPQSPSQPGRSGSPSTPGVPNVPAVTGLTCPTHAAAATVKVNTVYPRGRTARTVPLENGTVRATRIAAGPCAEKVVDLPVSHGTAAGTLEYGAWVLKVAGSDPATTWPAVAVTSAKAVSSVVDLAGSCPAGITKVAVGATNAPLLGLLSTPVLGGTVTATPVDTGGPCGATEPVAVKLDLLGKGTASLTPGKWAFSLSGRQLAAGSPSSVLTDADGGAAGIALVFK